MRPLSLLLLVGLTLATTTAPAGAELSRLERETVRQDAELAGQAKFCGMEWHRLYRAVVGNWRGSGRPETDVEEVDRIFREIMKSQMELLSPDFCGMGQIQVDYSMEQALRFYGVDPADAGD